MMAAIAASNGSNKVTLIEKNEKLGKKLFLTGKGRCNLTNACDVEELFNNVCRNPKFMYSAFYGFDNKTTMTFFENLGLNIKTERGNRVFPSSDHSSDVIKVLKNELERKKVNVLLNTTFVNFEIKGDKITGAILKKSGDSKNINLSADRLILATGGASYKSTGSDAKLFKILAKHNFEVIDLFPALVPLVCDNKYITDLQGIALKNVSVCVSSGGKEKYTGFGEMLFTHFGVSGPLILSASSYLSEKDLKTGVIVTVDLKPALSEMELDNRIQNEFKEYNNKQINNIIPKLVPSKMTNAILNFSKIPYEKKVNVITKEERLRLVHTLKNFTFEVSKVRDINEAIITRGGVSVKEINPATMESKKVSGLYFAGEMIDVDALTGGFNLQIAWSTGHLAGESAQKGE